MSVLLTSFIENKFFSARTIHLKLFTSKSTVPSTERAKEMHGFPGRDRNIDCILILVFIRPMH